MRVATGSTGNFGTNADNPPEPIHIGFPDNAGVIGAGRTHLSSKYDETQRPISLISAIRAESRPRARYAVSDGNRAAARIPIIAITIISSTSVKPRVVSFIRNEDKKIMRTHLYT
jgi:hypothetical protein